MKIRKILKIIILIIMFLFLINATVYASGPYYKTLYVNNKYVIWTFNIDDSTGKMNNVKLKTYDGEVIKYTDIGEQNFSQTGNNSAYPSRIPGNVIKEGATLEIIQWVNAVDENGTKYRAIKNNGTNSIDALYALDDEGNSLYTKTGSTWKDPNGDSNITIEESNVLKWSTSSNTPSKITGTNTEPTVKTSDNSSNVDSNTHKHQWSTAYSYNETDHWHECLQDNCPALIEEKSGYGYHNFVNGVCSVCGYKSSTNESNTHKHQWDTAYSYNETEHWHECLLTPCPATLEEKSGYGYHNFVNGVCSVCGYKSSANGSNTHEHNFSTKWTVDKKYHWHTCLVAGCNTVSDRSEHMFRDGICIMCKYNENTNSYEAEGMTWNDAEGKYTQNINPDDYAITPKIDESGSAVQLVKKILGMLNVLGVVILIITIVLLGIKYMAGTIEQKAEYKSTMMPILVGSILLFALSTIINLVYSIVSGL